jgi:putative transposase
VPQRCGRGRQPSELHPQHQLRISRGLRNRSPVDKAEPAGQFAPCIAGDGRSRVAGDRIIQIDPVKRVEELTANLDALALTETEDPAEGEFLGVAPDLTIIVVVSCGVSPLALARIRPGSRVENEVGEGIDAAAPRKPPSQTFLENHVQSLVSVDFSVVPTIRFQVLYVFLVLAHDRRRVLHFGVTAHPTAEWTAQQLREAFPWDSAPRYLLRDRDRIFGQDFRNQVKAMGIEEVLSAPRSPWQRAYVERVIGSIRRECLDHVIVLSEASLRRTLTSYFAYYHEWRTHLSLGKDAPESRRIQPPQEGRVIEIPAVGGLHHHYERRAA